MNVSQLHLYSIGIAAENKPLSTRKLNVTPVEILSALDGELNFAPQDDVHVGQDSDGNRYEVKSTTDMTLTAEWYPNGTNRVTPPDIRRGELIEIYRVADSDQFLWRCMGLRDDLRRLETVIFAFNASPKEGTKGIDPATCYFMEVSTHKKTVTFSTSQANGEPFGYQFQVNANDGQMVFEDTIGNSLFLDSGRVFWELINSNGTVLQLDHTNIYGKADNNIDMRAGNDMILKAGNNMKLTAGNQIYQEAPNHAIKSSTMTVEASTHDITCPASSYSGNVNIGGNLGLGGSISTGTSGGGGDANINGNMDVQGKMDITGTIRCDRLIASTSVSAPNL